MLTGIENVQPICLVCEKVFNSEEQVRRHLRKHKITFQCYTLRYRYKDIHPECACGCGQKTVWCVGLKDFNKYVHGHHAKGRSKSDNEKQKIGKKNRVNMKKYMSEHPEIARERSRKMTLAGINEEANRRRSESVHRFWTSDNPLTHQRRKEASDRAIILLDQQKIGPNAPYKCQWRNNPFTEKPEYMHSSWESNFLDRCIQENYPVTKSHDIRIDYQQIDGTWHQYVPDFKSLSEDKLFEIKGNMTDNDKLKILAAQSLGYEVVLIEHD